MTRFRTAPKTEEVYCLLKKKIADGAYSQSGTLPVEPVLAEELGVSRKTLRSALSRLAMENIVERVKGKGTFICDNAIAKKILVIVGDIENIIDPGRYILPGIQQEAAAAGFAVETCSTISLELTERARTVELIKQKNYIGVLSFSANFYGNEPVIEILKQTGLPVILVHGLERDLKTTGFAVMGTDYHGVIRDGLEYLFRQGHRKVCYLACRPYRISREEYFSLVRDIGLDDDPALRAEISSYSDEKIISEEIAAFFDTLGEMPTAVFCFSDFLAVCLYKYLQKKNIRIPEDIAVLSCGGLIGCDFLSPPLSAIDFNYLEIGRSSVRTLLEMKMKNITSLPFIRTPHHLSERVSTQIRR